MVDKGRGEKQRELQKELKRERVEMERGEGDTVA